MLSTFPAMSTSDSFVQFSFPALEAGFTPWDCPEPPFVIPCRGESSSPENPQEWVMPDSPSDNSNPKLIASNSGVNRGDSAVDERKRRRMISNRESARRSRLRKQRQLQNLREEMNRLITANRELMNRLSFVAHHCQLLRNENDRLVSEFLTLRRKLLNMRQVLLHRRLQHLSATACPCNTTTAPPVNQQTHPYN